MSRVYSDYAFCSNEREQLKSNMQLYEELRQKYRILIYTGHQEYDASQYDIVAVRTPGYHHSEYWIRQKDPKLSMDELALICDGGRLIFGYTVQKATMPIRLYIFED